MSEVGPEAGAGAGAGVGVGAAAGVAVGVGVGAGVGAEAAPGAEAEAEAAAGLAVDTGRIAGTADTGRIVGTAGSTVGIVVDTTVQWRKFGLQLVAQLDFPDADLAPLHKV